MKLSTIINIVLLLALLVMFYLNFGINKAISLFHEYSKSQEYSQNQKPVQTYNDIKNGYFKGLKVDSNSIVFLGNSLIDSYEWHEAFRSSRVINRGINGDRLNHLINRLDPILIGKPEKIFIMAGTNDLAAGKEPKVIVELVKDLIGEIKKHSPRTKLYVYSILPTDKYAGRDQEAIKEINLELKDLSNQLDFIFIDLYPSFADENEELIQEYTYDGLHLNQRGYEQWVSLTKQYIN
jgi:lysophospholipase L1-like esterase